jgi:hypothetical protein
MTPPGNSSALQVQIDGLGERMQQGFDDIKGMLRSYEERTRLLEIKESGCQPIIHARLDAMQQDISDHKTKFATKSQQINSLEKQVARLATMYGFFIFVGSAFGISLISLIWALITGRAEVIFK